MVREGKSNTMQNLARQIFMLLQRPDHIRGREIFLPGHLGEHQWCVEPGARNVPR